MKKRSGILLGFFCLIAFGAHQTAEAQSNGAALEADTPIIDGVIDEAIWNDALEVADFLSSARNDGGGELARTTVRVIVDRHAVYVAARMTAESHRPGGERPERGFTSDWFITTFEGDAAPDRAVVLAVNEVGVARGFAIADGVEREIDLTDGWDFATRAEVDGWSAELLIPIQELIVGDRSGEQLFDMSFDRRLRQAGTAPSAGNGPIPTGDMALKDR